MIKPGGKRKLLKEVRKLLKTLKNESDILIKNILKFDDRGLVKSDRIKK